MKVFKKFKCLLDYSLLQNVLLFGVFLELTCLWEPVNFKYLPDWTHFVLGIFLLFGNPFFIFHGGKPTTFAIFAPPVTYSTTKICIWELNSTLSNSQKHVLLVFLITKYTPKIVHFLTQFVIDETGTLLVCRVLFSHKSQCYIHLIVPCSFFCLYCHCTACCPISQSCFYFLYCLFRTKCKRVALHVFRFEVSHACKK